ncbi:hypothetical protein PMI16_02890 [Herbaspirillum sp. CF444]|uniref:hypothetical protein n=1 Tax=Herbaspirillum sp. CF444 TaxID=1144319 RepID=UPI0002728406|nr:hypothetical protein [Herbaspirillum sp. CF444]EJL87546.1 hypothetical protein PMI16_02890 [Herbaspirillum sp. CF444]
MTLPTHRLSPAIATLLAATLLLSACLKDSAPRENTLAATPQEAGSWDTLPQGGALRAAEQLYRACAREAAQLHLPTREFPEVSNRVTYLTQDGQRIRKTEQLHVDIDDMHIDNGCATRLVKRVSIDVISSDRTSVDETGRTLARKRDDNDVALPDGAARMQLTIARIVQPAPSCTLRRDPGPQSHFMMLNLCRNEERRAEQEQQQHREDTINHPKKNAAPATSS